MAGASKAFKLLSSAMVAGQAVTASGSASGNPRLELSGAGSSLSLTGNEENVDRLSTSSSSVVMEFLLAFKSDSEPDSELMSVGSS